MPPDHPCPDVAFDPAPDGVRLRLTSRLTALLMMLAFAGVAVAAAVRRDPQLLWVSLIAAVIAPAGTAIGWWAARIRGYRLAGGELLIERRFRALRFPLEGLVSAAPDREAMRRAWKVCGNGGLGAFAGRFRSRRLGPFQAFLTDAEHAVVLRWPQRCLVISPRQPSIFLDTIRRRAGLSA